MSFDIEAKRAARRAAMPITTAFVESLERDGLFPKVIYASENNIVVGKKPNDLEVFTIPKGYRMFVEPAKKDQLSEQITEARPMSRGRRVIRAIFTTIERQK